MRLNCCLDLPSALDFGCLSRTRPAREQIINTVLGTKFESQVFFTLIAFGLAQVVSGCRAVDSSSEGELRGVDSSDGEHGVNGVPASCGQQPASSSSTVPASSSTVQAAVVALDLKSIQLQCGAAGITVREQLTSYERSQMDPHRIRKLLSEKCGCRDGCFAKLKPKESQLLQVGRVRPPSNFRTVWGCYPLPCPTDTLALPRPHTVAWRVTWRC